MRRSDEDSERVGGEDALRRSEALFRAVIEKSGEIMSLTSADGTTRYLTPLAWRLLGWTPEEMGERTFRDQVVPEDREKLATALAHLVRTGARDLAMELRVRHRDGSLRWIESTGTNLLDDPDVRAIVGNYRDITARKLADEALRASRNQLEEAQAIAQLGSWSAGLGPDDEVTWSAQCYGIFGIPAGARVTKPMLLASIHPADRDRFRRAIAELIAGGGTYDVEHRVQWPDGQVRWVLSRAVVERDPTGQPARLLGAVQDVTERHETIAKLQASEERYRRIVENTSEGVWLYDAAALTVFMNGQMAAMLGYTPEETVGQSILAFMDASDHASALARVERRRRGHSERADVRLRRRDGSEVWVLLQANPIFGADGTFEGGIVLATDISLRRVADEARARLAAIIESSEDAIASIGLDRTITTWNRGAERLYGHATAQLVGSPFSILLPATSRADELRAIDRVASGGPTCHYDTSHVRSDGSQVEVAVTLSPVTDASGVVIAVAAVAKDLTARREADAAHRRTEDQFRQAQKMEAVGRLAGGVAHDFNNLLSVILSYSQFAIEDLRPGDPLRDDMLQIDEAGKRARDLTRQLLAFSRQQILQPRVLDVNAVLAPMERMLRRLLGEDVALTLLASATGLVLADPGQLEQVVMNLAVNARDAMPDGGSLTIETTDARFGEPPVGGPATLAPGDYVLLAVSDTGTGMDAATCTRIFEPFFTTKEDGKGTGLGLSTVFGIVRQSGGHVGVYSELGHGTTFKVYLPVTDRPAETTTADRAPLVLRGTETILLVEDEDQVRAVASTILRRNGYHVLETSNGGEAFLVSKDFTATIHLMLTDVVMPRMSGRKLAEELAPLRPDMRVLYASGYTDDAIVQHGVLEAGVAFIQKPFTPDALLRKVREVLDAPRRNG